MRAHLIDIRTDLRQLQIARLWGAPRIYGELLKLGLAVAQSTVAKYMAKIDGQPAGQSWGTFLRNHLPHIAAVDLFVVCTETRFRLLFGRLDRRSPHTRFAMVLRAQPVISASFVLRSNPAIGL